MHCKLVMAERHIDMFARLGMSDTLWASPTQRLHAKQSQTKLHRSLPLLFAFAVLSTPAKAAG